MARSSLLFLGFLASVWLTACGGGETAEEEKRSESSQNCEDVCNFWAECNSAELPKNACATHCNEQAEEVSADCLDLYVEQTSCEAKHLDCSDLLGMACEAEFDAYYDCATGGASSASESTEDTSADPPTDDRDRFR